MLSFGLLTYGAYSAGGSGGGSGGGGSGGVPTGTITGPSLSIRNSDDADTLMDFMPWYFKRDDRIRGLMAAAASEMKRIERAGEALRSEWFATNATDAIGLPIWEASMGLPVAPAGLTVEQRRDLVVANMRARHSPRGLDWQAALTKVLGTGWSYQEDVGSYTVRILLPYASGTYSAEQVLALARALTPAHIAISTTYGVGFLIGISLIGIDLL